MTFYVEEYLARQLGVRGRTITSWTATVEGVWRGRVEAHVQVKLHCSYGELADLREKFTAGDARTSLTTVTLGFSGYDHQLAEVDLRLVCLYGKETQHLFRALHQQFSVRGKPPKGRTK